MRFSSSTKAIGLLLGSVLMMLVMLAPSAFGQSAVERALGRVDRVVSIGDRINNTASGISRRAERVKERVGGDRGEKQRQDSSAAGQSSQGGQSDARQKQPTTDATSTPEAAAVPPPLRARRVTGDQKATGEGVGGKANDGTTRPRTVARSDTGTGSRQ